MKKYLKYYNIKYNINKYVCNSCKKAKTIKYYNQTLQQKTKRLYQIIHINCLYVITLIGFKTERYFFIFTNDYICIIKTYIAKQKSKWLKNLKIFYNFI